MTMPFDYQNELAKIAQQREMARALQQRSMQPIQQQSAGRTITPTSWSQVLAQALQGYLGRKDLEQADQASGALSQRYKQELAKGLENYSKTRDGAPSAPIPMSPQAQEALMAAGPPRPEQTFSPEVQADPRRAAIEALTSGMEPLQALGQADLTRLNKGPEYKVVNGKLIAITPEGPQVAGDYSNRFGAIERIGTDAQGRPLMGQVNKETGEARFAPGGGSQVTVNTGEGMPRTKFTDKIDEKRADMLTTSYDNAKIAANTLPAIENAFDVLKGGVKSGITSDISMGLSKIGAALGMPDDPQVANTELYRSQMAQQVFQLIKNLGTGTAVSDADLKFAERAAGADAALDNATLVRMVEIAKAALGNTLMSHDRLLEKALKTSGADSQDLEMFRVPFSFNAGKPGEFGYTPYNEGAQRLEPGRFQGDPSKPAQPAQAPAPAVKWDASKEQRYQEWLKAQGAR